jgi:hypothetical protein
MERKVCTIELTEPEAIALLESALEARKWTKTVKSASQKLKQALEAEQGTGGNFDVPPQDWEYVCERKDSPY